MEQPEYSMLKRDRVELEYAPLYRKFGTGLTVFSPLKQGILTGKYNNGIPEDSRAQKTTGFLDSIEGDVLTKVAKLEPIAKKLGASQGQLALAWVIKNEHVSSAIIGATSVDQVTENLKSLELLDRLTPEVMKEIDEILGNAPELPLMRFT
jgi:aryl-alcohol dehydrogenase-like predicted oxidoreductase